MPACHLWACATPVLAPPGSPSLNWAGKRAAAERKKVSPQQMAGQVVSWVYRLLIRTGSQTNFNFGWPSLLQVKADKIRG